MMFQYQLMTTKVRINYETTKNLNEKLSFSDYFLYFCTSYQDFW